MQHYVSKVIYLIAKHDPHTRQEVVMRLEEVVTLGSMIWMSLITEWKANLISLFAQVMFCAG